MVSDLRDYLPVFASVSISFAVFYTRKPWPFLCVYSVWPCPDTRAGQIVRKNAKEQCLCACWLCAVTVCAGLLCVRLPPPGGGVAPRFWPHPNSQHYPVHTLRHAHGFFYISLNNPML